MGKRLKNALLYVCWTSWAFGLMAAFSQYWEFAYRLWENGLLDHPLRSHVLMHHGYWGFLLIVLAPISIQLISWRLKNGS